jgi:branched-chain amino acid transport system ATP-binding protein
LEGNPILRVSRLCSGYGAIEAAKDVSLDVGRGELVALIGPNGAGKSTLINSLAGLVRMTSGSVLFDGREVRSDSSSRRVRSGIAVVPEGRHVVAPLTVAENLSLSAYGRGRARSGEGWGEDRVYSLFPRLAERRHQLAGSLSGGEQQMLALGRALLTDPDLLLLDEPSMGLAPSVVDKVFDSIIEINQAGVSVLLVEQNVALSLSVADHCHIMQRGRIVLAGTPAELRGSTELEEAYLG